jgi:DNA-binding response OmpR family regulator
MDDGQILLACESATAPLKFQTNPPHRILVVDDDEDIRRMNTETLVHSGYAADSAEDGEAGWKALNSDSYDLLITDHNMPKMSGFELVQKVRAARMALPVIMATGTFPKEDFAQSPALQPAATLLKPYTIGEMLRTVKKVLRELKILADPPPPGPANPPDRILVVDDDPYSRHLNADVLIRHGYEVNAAEDGATGWEELQANRYKLLITEHELPRLTGVKLLMKLRAARMALPVIVATGTLPKPDFTKRPRLQPTATLIKPFTPDELLATVNKVLGSTDSPREQLAPRPGRKTRSRAAGLES